MSLRSRRLAVAAAAFVAAGAARAAVPGLPSAAAPPAPAPAPAGTAGTTAAPPAPLPIPLEHVFRAADELEEPLRSADDASRHDPAIDDVERRLAASAPVVASLRAELDGPRLHDVSAREIARLRQAVAREDASLAGAQDALQKRAELLAGAARALQDRLASWQLTGAAARQERAPEPVLRRIAQTEERLRAEEARLRAERDRLLGLQAQVSDLRAELDAISAAVEAADETLERELFEVESAPLWRAMTGAGRGGALGQQLRQALRESGRDVGSFLAAEQKRVWFQLAVLLALGLALLALRQPVTALASADDDPALRGAVKVVARPWSAALLVSVLLAGRPGVAAPPTVRDLVLLGMLVPLLRLLPGLLKDTFRRPLWALAALFALDKLASLAPPRTLLARLAVLVVTAGALAALVRGLRPGGWLRILPGNAWGAATRAAGVAALGLLAVSAVSNVVGNATLAERLTRATLASATLAAVLVGVQVALEGALAALLHLPALQRRPLVARHRALLERRTAKLLRAVAALLWASRTALEFGVAGAAAGAFVAVLGLRLKVGGLDVSLGNVVAFGVTLALAVAISRAIRFVLDEGLFTELSLPRGIAPAVSTTVQYVLVLLGFSWAVLASGMEMSRFSFIVGALGVGIGFGLQNVVNNFVSGLILLYERPVQIRDVVEIGPVLGEVTRIGVRSSTVRTFAGAEVIVPNATLISAEVTNWTLSDRRRRIELAVNVAYGTDPQAVVELLRAAVRGRAGVLPDPEPVALFLRFGDSALEFVLRFWTADFDTWQVLASDVLIEVHASLRRAGIEIPFPQRDLHVRSVDAAAVRALASAASALPDPAADARRPPPPTSAASRR